MNIAPRIMGLAANRLAIQLFVVAMLMGVAFAGPSPPDIAGSISDLCANIKAAVPVLAFVMLLLGGIIYAGGQIMGAETRARANVWATAMLTGGVIGLIIAAGAPYMLKFFWQMFADPGVTSDFTC